ncbi:MAG TPA: DNA polymerase domain-containing protein [Candidatus Deferrimicrobium sp.]|nr:DNA polymerase domain-containing protein [Candidatus Deferrimicrobium sp.]
MALDLDAWLLDLNVEGDRIALWLKHPTKVIRKLIEYKPSFYVVPQRKALHETKQVLESHPDIDRVEIVQRFHPIQSHEKRPVLLITCDRLSTFARTWHDIENLEKVEVCNVDFPLEQKWLYETGFFPMAKLKYTAGDTLSALELCDSQEAIHYEIPDLTRVKLEVGIKTQYAVARPQDSLSWIRLHNGEEILLDKMNEHDMILELIKTVHDLDPDIIETDNGDNFLFPYLITRASKYALLNTITFSRDGIPLHKCLQQFHGSGSYFSYGVMYYRPSRQVCLHGRIHVDIGSGTHAFPLQGLPGMVEVARVTLSPLQKVSRITIGQAMSSMQFYKAHQLGLLIPLSKTNTAEYFKSGLKMLESDRGGFVYSPIVGFFEKVAETDFASMYPSIMLTRNISPETILCSCKDSPLQVPELGYNVCNRRIGLIPQALELILTKRKTYKLLAKAGSDKERYSSMEKALKWILVTCFGYTGYRNARFGRIEAHESVTAWARKILLEAAQIAEGFGLEVIHGIVDSLWLSGSENEHIYEQFCEAVTAATEIEMQSKGIYKWVVFLPTKASPAVGALTHYYGVFRDGTIKVRGLELRRHDTPLLIKQAQDEIMGLLAKANNWYQFQKLLPHAQRTLQQYIDRVMHGDVALSDLLVTMRISRHPEAYKNYSRQAIAAWQAKRLGMELQPGQMVHYLITNARAKRPQERVLIAQLLDRTTPRYDRDTYRKLLDRMFENMLLFMPLQKRKSLLFRNKCLV